MATIRPLERGDLPAVSALVRAHLPGWSRNADVLARNLLDHPWAPDEPRALVAVAEDGEITGSIGAQVRRLRFDDRQLTGICVSHLVVAPERRDGAAGAMLVKRLLSGDQDLTWTDSGTDQVVRIWRMFGAHVDHTRTCDWMLVLRAGRWLGHVASTASRQRGRVGRRAVPVAGLPLHAARRLVGADADPQPQPEVAGSSTTPSMIAESLAQISKGVRLRVDHDDPYLEYLFAHLDSLTGPVVRRLVRRQGKPIGWYAYIAGAVVGRVIHVAANVREAEAVVADLVGDARGRGVAVLTGRLEPHLDEPLRRRFAVIGFAQRPMIHARDPELLAMLASSRSLLTEIDLIDSEWWQAGVVR